MKTLFLIVLLFMASVDCPAQNSEIGVMTFNIRCGSCEKPDDVNHWGRRQLLVSDLIAQHQPDLIGLQEAELFQVRDLTSALSGYAGIAVGRDDGREKGEATAILYRKSRFELIESATYWLSPTPVIVGIGWDAALNRTVTTAKLKDLQTGRIFCILNTHFDHRGQLARVESTKQIVKLANSIGESLPVIVTGDFNYTKDHAAYTVIASALQDAEHIAAVPARGGDISFNAFGSNSKPGNKIDYIFVNDRVEVLSHTIVTDLYQGRYPSDHFPIETRVRLR